MRCLPLFALNSHEHPSLPTVLVQTDTTTFADDCQMPLAPLAAAVLVLAPAATGTGGVAPDFRLGADERLNGSGLSVGS